MTWPCKLDRRKLNVVWLSTFDLWLIHNYGYSIICAIVTFYVQILPGYICCQDWHLIRYLEGKVSESKLYLSHGRLRICWGWESLLRKLKVECEIDIGIDFNTVSYHGNVRDFTHCDLKSGWPIGGKFSYLTILFVPNFNPYRICEFCNIWIFKTHNVNSGRYGWEDRPNRACIFDNNGVVSRIDLILILS